MNVTLFVIGDEILSGKRRDKHLSKVIELLAERGMVLSAAEFLGDDQVQIAAAIVRVVARGDLLLSCGGIGATPDDCTRQGAAIAFGRPLQRHPEGVRLIEAQYGERAYPHRVIMVEFPQGADLIPNPVNRVPGFSVGDAHFVPGFPEMAWPMLEWLLDTRYPQLHNAEPPVEYRLRAYDAAEGDLLPLMEATLAAHPGVKLSSLPFRARPDAPGHIEFGFKGPGTEAAAAYRLFEGGLIERAVHLDTLSAPSDR